MIYYIPLEYIGNRYTKDMDRILQAEFKRQGKEYVTIGNPDVEQVIPNKKDFLNSTGTNITRLSQLQEIAKLFAEGKINDGDVFFFSDLWAAGIESIPYMAYFNDKKVRITGILHAGSFTPSDFVANMKYWAKDFEKAIIKMSDKVFLGSSQPLMDLIDQDYIDTYGKMYITGVPVSTDIMNEYATPLPWEDRENTIVFSGRLVDEKQPHLFDRMAADFPQYKFVKTLELGLSKKEYYELLAKSKVFVSFAKQENYGIAAVEAQAMGMNLLVPNDLAYKDFYGAAYRYNDLEAAYKRLPSLMVHGNVDKQVEEAKKHNKNVEKIVNEL